jgi:hypothetical protein
VLFFGKNKPAKLNKKAAKLAAKAAQLKAKAGPADTVGGQGVETPSAVTPPVDGTVVDGLAKGGEPQWGQTEPALQILLEAVLNCPVSTPDEKFRKRFNRRVLHTATNPVLLVSGAIVGVGIATVLTAGTVHIALLAAGGATLASNDSSLVETWKKKRKDVVRLDKEAVAYLLTITKTSEVVRTVRRALETAGNSVLTAPLLKKCHDETTAVEATPQGPDSTYGAAHIGGLALLAAGLFLITVVVVPEYIRDPILRAAVVISVIGAILIAFVLVGPFKSELKPKKTSS